MNLHKTAVVLLDAIQKGRVHSDASNASIGQTLGWCARTVSTHLRQLEDAGLIQIDRRPPNRQGPGTDPTGRTIRATTGVDHADAA